MLAKLRRVIWTRKWLIIAVFLLTVVTGTTVTLLIFPTYEARMSLLISRQRADPQISPGEKTPEVLLGGVSDEEFNSELELLKNSEVVGGAVRDLDLVNNQEPKIKGAVGRLRRNIRRNFGKLIGDFMKMFSDSSDADKQNSAATEEAIKTVTDNLTVEPIKKSRVIKVTYNDTEPERGKQTLDAIYRNYVALKSRINENSSVTAVFDAQSADYEAKLKTATENLKNFDRANNVTGAEINSQTDILQKQYYATQAQVEQTRTDSNETEKRIGALKAQIAAEPKNIQTGSVSKYVAALDSLKNQLVDLQQERTKLLQKYKPGTRFVVDVEEKIQNVERAIAVENANPPQEKTFALNENRRRLENDLSTAEVNLASLKSRERDLTALAEQQRAAAVGLNSKGIEREKLERERKVNEDNYLLYQKKARESEVGQVLNNKQVVNVGLADAPRTDGLVKSPKLFINFPVLIGLGLLAGLAAALAADKLAEERRNADATDDDRRRVNGMRPLPSIGGNRVNGQLSINGDDNRQFSQNSNLSLTPGHTFTDNDDDEKLTEISEYFRFHRRSSKFKKDNDSR